MQTNPASYNPASVAITGGTISGITSLSLVASSSATASATTFFASSTITTNPASQSSVISVAVIGKITYTGTGGFDATAHNVGTLGYALMNSSGQTASLLIGLEGKLSNTAGTITTAVACENQLADNAGTITTCILTDSQVVGNAGTITALAGFRTSIANAGTITTAYGHYFQSPTGTIPTNVLAHHVENFTSVTTAKAYSSALNSNTTKNHNLYFSGSAPSYMAGVLKIGSETDSGNGGLLQITGATDVLADRGIYFNNQTNAAAAQVATLTNSPTAGNPAWWLKVKIGGVNAAIPAWLG